MTEIALVKNAADKKQTKRAAVLERLRISEELSDIAFILGSEIGRRFIYRILGKCGIFKKSYYPNSQDTAFYEGRRSIGLELFAKVNETKPEYYIQMMKEENQRRENENVRASSNNGNKGGSDEGSITDGSAEDGSEDGGGEEL